MPFCILMFLQGLPSFLLCSEILPGLSHPFSCFQWQPICEMTLQSIPLPRSLSILQTHKPNYPLFCQLTLHLFHKHVKPSRLYILILFPFNYASSLYPTTKIRNLGVMLDCSFFFTTLHPCSVSRHCQSHFRNTPHIQPLLLNPTVATWVQTFISLSISVLSWVPVMVYQLVFLPLVALLFFFQIKATQC